MHNWDGHTLLTLAHQSYQAGNYKQALEHSKAVYERSPRRTDNLLLLGAIYYQLHDFDMCIAKNEEALRINPHFAECYANTANSWMAKGNINVALDNYLKAINLRPNFVDAWSNVAIAYMKKGRLDEAIYCCRRALSFNPCFVDAHNILGNLMKKQGLVQEAYNSYVEALRIQPTSAVACFNLAEIYKESGDLNKALHYYDKAVKLKPDYSAAYLNLGNVYMDLKMCDNAIVCYQRWLQSRPDYVMAFSHLGTNCSQIDELPVKPSLDSKVTGVLEVGYESSAGNGEPLLVPSNTAPDEESHKEEKLKEDPIVMISEIGSDSNAIEPEMEIKGVKAGKTETEDVASEVETEPFICDKEVETEIEDVAPNSTGEGPPLHTTGIQGTIVSPLIQEEPCITDGTQYDHKIKKNVDLNNQPTCSIDASFLEQVVVAFKEVKINQESTILAKEPISVNPSLEPTFLAIIKKYGDITKDCPLESGYLLTSVVEVICKVVQELQKKHLTEVDRNILNSYYLVVRDAEKIKINVNWLRAQLDEIKDVVKSIVEAKDLNDEKNRIAEQIENKKKDLESMKVELEKLKSEIERKENLLDMDTLKTEGLIRTIKDRGPRIQRFQNMVLMEEFQ